MLDGLPVEVEMAAANTATSRQSTALSMFVSFQ